jgi:hypothetical protein
MPTNDKITLELIRDGSKIAEEHEKETTQKTISLRNLARPGLEPASLAYMNPGNSIFKPA